MSVALAVGSSPIICGIHAGFSVGLIPGGLGDGTWLRKNVSERSKATSDWLASTVRRADWLFLRLRGLETLLKLPEVILSDLETPRQPAAQARIAARSGFTPTMFITRVRL